MGKMSTLMPRTRLRKRCRTSSNLFSRSSSETGTTAPLKAFLRTEEFSHFVRRAWDRSLLELLQDVDRPNAPIDRQLSVLRDCVIHWCWNMTVGVLPVFESTTCKSTFSRLTR
uniref:Uncharacterized protein n=1 Tax=Noctiluca scintillans TaxID=2966 RepID=A0A7S1AQE7_NOCSC